MKKLALTSLLALFATVGASNAANVIDFNPLYRPDANRFYSVTTLNTFVNTDGSDFKSFGLNEEFGYGISDSLAIIIGAGLSENDGFSDYGWDNFSAALNMRVLNAGGWKADAFGGVKLNNIWAKGGSFVKEENTMYDWNAGLRAGFVGEGWTLAVRGEYIYGNTEMFNWDNGDFSGKSWKFGADGQFLFNDCWNLVAGVEYQIFEESPITDPWFGLVGINYNFDEYNVLGAYARKQLNGDNNDAIEVGIRYGVDF